MACSACGDKPKKTSCEFPRAIVEIDNAEQISLFRKVVVPTSMGDDTTVPPTIGKYHNVLLYYEANHKSYLYSSDGIPTLLANGLTDYEQAVNLPEINGHTLLGNQTGPELDLQNILSVIPDTGIKLENDELSGIPATDTTIGMVKPGNGLEVDSNGELKISLNVAQSDWTEADNAELSYIKNKPTIQSITMTDVDPGEGSPLAENNFIAVYEV